MPTSPSPKNPNKAAKRLRKALLDGDPDAIKRSRAVYHDLAGVPDADVPAHMPLMRCQHVISKELGADSWKEMKDAQLWMAVGRLGTDDLHSLKMTSELEPVGSRIRGMMADIFDGEKGYCAVGTRKECEDLVEWSIRVLPLAQRFPPKTVNIGGKSILLKFDTLRIEPYKERDDDDSGGDEFNQIMDYNEPSGN